jgi:hypothetical protein
MSQRPSLFPQRAHRTRALTSLAGLIVAHATLAPVRADDDSRAEIERLRERIEKLERDAAERRAPAAPGEPAAPEAKKEPEAPTRESSVDVHAPWNREAIDTPPELRGVYDKPFLASLWRRAYLGGYTELEYHSFENGILGFPEGFWMHRTNLFLFSDVADRVRFGSEIEFENEFEGSPSPNFEVAIEMAFVDWTIFEELKLRGGAILAPLGRINVNHDGPIRELTERPLVSTFVIPTTLTEAGVGPHGAFSLGDSLSLSYEAYAVNGFNLLSSDGELAVDVTEKEQLLREGRTSVGGDINSGIATTGRIGLQALKLFEFGGSWHVGTYDERGDNFLTIVAGDGAIVHEAWGARFALEGEVAVASFQRDDFARSAGVPERFWGYYVQGSVGGMPGFLRQSVPYIFDDRGASLGFALRWDWVDLDGDQGAIIEPGVTFRPVADTVFKFSYKLTQLGIGIRGVPGREDIDDDGFVFSMSSYF